jgi:hypothetical protein
MPTSLGTTTFSIVVGGAVDVVATVSSRSSSFPAELLDTGLHTHLHQKGLLLILSR